MSERQRKPPPNRAEAGGELGHVRIISYNIQVSVLITFHRFLIVNYRVCRVALHRFPRAQGTTSRRRRHMRMRKRRTKSEFEAIKAPVRVFEREPRHRVASRRIESSPREHRGLRRVDVDVREFFGPIGVHER